MSGDDQNNNHQNETSQEEQSENTSTASESTGATDTSGGSSSDSGDDSGSGESSTESTETVGSTEQVTTAPHPDAVAMANKFPAPPAPFEKFPPMLYAFCQAIQAHEAYFAPGEDHRYPQGTRSYFDNNPGNLKFRGQEGTKGEDKDGFAIFVSYDEGFLALMAQVELAISGRSTAYKNPIWDQGLKTWRPMNFMDFFKVYDSSYGDNPTAYAEAVAKALSVPVDTPINNLVAA